MTTTPTLQKISERTLDNNIDGTEIIPIIHPGETTGYKITTQQIIDTAVDTAVDAAVDAVVIPAPDPDLVTSVNGKIGDVLTDATLITDATTARTLSALDARSYIRFTNAGAKTYTFTAASMIAVNTEILVRNVGAGDLTLVGSGVTLNADVGGTLVVPQNGTVAIKIIGATEADVMGATVAA